MAPLRITRPPALDRALSPLIAGYLRLLAATCRLEPVAPVVQAAQIARIVHDEQELRRRFAPPYILAFWHNRLAVPAFHFRADRPATLISRHADGDLIAAVVQRLGMTALRGGTFSGDAAATSAALTTLHQGRSVGVTPDGPLGPRYVARSGAVYLASRSGAPIIPFSCSARPRLELSSWDRFHLPFPASRVRIGFGEPFSVPRDAATKELEHWRRHLERALRDLTALVDQAGEREVGPPLSRTGQRRRR